MKKKIAIYLLIIALILIFHRPIGDYLNIYFVILIWIIAYYADRLFSYIWALF